MKRRTKCDYCKRTFNKKEQKESDMGHRSICGGCESGEPFNLSGSV